MSYSLDNDLDTIEDALTHLHRSASQHNAWEALMKQAGVSVDRSGAIILHILAKHENNKNCRIGTLAGSLGVEAPSVTRQVQQLEAAGLITRSPDPQDGRAFVVQVTAAGRKTARQIEKAKRDYLSSILGTWSTKDRHQLASLFHRLAEQVTNQQIDKSK